MSQDKPNPWMLATFVLIGLIAGFGISQIPYLQFQGDSSKTSVVEAPSQKPSAPVIREEEIRILTPEQITKLPDDDAVKGDNSAPVTIVEFSDFQCPFCAKFFKLTLPLIEENYIKTGKIKLIYRDFPLSSHPQAIPAALAAECADDQSAFWKMHDAIFNGQEAWSGNEKVEEIMKDYAKNLKLNIKAFNACLDSKLLADEVRKDMVEGALYGVSGTPAFFINGKFLSGAMPYEEVFKPILDAELEKKEWKLQFDPATGRPSIIVANE